MLANAALFEVSHSSKNIRSSCRRRILRKALASSLTNSRYKPSRLSSAGMPRLHFMESLIGTPSSCTELAHSLHYHLLRSSSQATRLYFFILEHQCALSGNNWSIRILLQDSSTFKTAPQLKYNTFLDNTFQCFQAFSVYGSSPAEARSPDSSDPALPRPEPPRWCCKCRHRPESAP